MKKVFIGAITAIFLCGFIGVRDSYALFDQDLKDQIAALEASVHAREAGLSMEKARADQAEAGLLHAKKEVVFYQKTAKDLQVSLKQEKDRMVFLQAENVELRKALVDYDDLQLRYQQVKAKADSFEEKYNELFSLSERGAEIGDQKDDI